MSLEETLGRLQDTTQRAIMDLWARRLAGTLSLDEFERLATIVLETATRQGASLGALSIRAYLEAVTGAPQPAPTVTPEPAAPKRLDRALQTIVATSALEEVPMRLERLAGNEPMEAMSTGAREAMTTDSRVHGWTRGLEADACELCEWWWRDGRVWQPDHPMPRHPGCNCHPVPAIAVGTANAQTEKQAREAARRAGRAPERSE